LRPPEGLGLDGSEHDATLKQVGMTSRVLNTFEVALLVENGPGNARELVGKRDRRERRVGETFPGGREGVVDLIR